MSESLEYIEAYFEQKLSLKEKQIFEDRCIRDVEFAGEVAFYISSREAVRQKLLERKINQWSVDENNTFVDKPGVNTKLPSGTAPVKRMAFRKWLPYVAAACLLLAVATYSFYSRDNLHQLAADHVKSLTHVYQNMGVADNFQQGIFEYNERNYDKALVLLKDVYRANPDNSDAKKYIGQAYLLKKDYDQALVHFDELSRRKDLITNPGVFLKAVTLLERNKQGDKEAAKALLEQVAHGNGLAHKKEATEWLKKW